MTGHPAIDRQSQRYYQEGPTEPRRSTTRNRAMPSKTRTPERTQSSTPERTQSSTPEQTQSSTPEQTQSPGAVALVPTLCVEMPSSTLCVDWAGHEPQMRRLSGRRESQTAFPRRAWERVTPDRTQFPKAGSNPIPQSRIEPNSPKPDRTQFPKAGSNPIPQSRIEPISTAPDRTQFPNAGSNPFRPRRIEPISTAPDRTHFGGCRGSLLALLALALAFAGCSPAPPPAVIARPEAPVVPRAFDMASVPDVRFVEITRLAGSAGRAPPDPGPLPERRQRPLRERHQRGRARQDLFRDGRGRWRL
jgi:hypothetical protein